MIYRYFVCWILSWAALLGAVNAAEKKPVPPKTQLIKMVYLAQEREAPAALSNLDPFIQNKGEPGADLAVSDNNTTGQFTQQRYELKKVIVPTGGDLLKAFEQLGDDIGLVVLNVPAEHINLLADSPTARNKLLFDAASRDDELRGSQCRRNVLHILPSRAMRADALAQYLLKKRWQKWFLVVGPTPADRLYADAVKRTAKRFGMKLMEEKTWTHDFDSHRTEQADIAQFTQVGDYDVLVVADEQGLFGDYLDYRTWLPRPVIGTQGLIATAWHRTHEQWGAVQLQNRFLETTGRWMEEEDYAAYLAVRAIGEASVRAKSSQVQAIKDYMLSNAFTLQGYKGVPLSFRAWDGQLRQPILLAAPRSLVGVAPIEGFLHPKTELDTLGYDQPETTCHY
ncbi:MAG: ABC transporter substrate-binding protein [Methylomonas sp.]|nr:ABC transporter substrate-binding protein [Methylomonas sp.]PPD22589.1 MAG: branched-chain amino acid ABC transporter substrate-binding protein [Methylomonas sp.]PPD27899.1 MAG: branched-chain amino acid ABC transporter substrate-binding protein [Methylomonas sp.]PPD40009.1 MAG: branched-chain amino acid ABC transporter substrate-binding protein [Methylomonas sp.]PPD51997.1 MAG: branched-chain amino acid ABC transporter substrate-binding protein [Methylomonas sp.]